MNLLARREMGSDGGGHHQPFAQKFGVVNEHGTQNHGQKKQVGQPVEPPLILRCLPPPNFARRAGEIAPVHDVKHRQQAANADTPHRQAMLGHPPERNPGKISQEQGRIADGRQAAAHVRDDENEENNVVRRDPIPVHANPGPDEQHGRARRPQRVCPDGSDQKEHHVRHRRGFPLDLDMNPARNHEQGTNQRDEAGVFVRRTQHPPVSLQPENIVSQCDRSQAKGRLRIMFRPPSGKKQRAERNGRQQHAEGRNHPGIWLEDSGIHAAAN